ncbi:MAG: DnaB helicase C-terminal domain-containing protein [Alkalibacterium sp.]|nr:DnaB helicase C-terminal domain-containing protein [Alkalibacterium sp.]
MSKLEQKVLGKMLNDIDDVKMQGIEAKWFEDRAHYQLASILLQDGFKYNDYSEIELAVRDTFPQTVITEDWLHQVKFEEVFIDDLTSSVQSLKESYYQRRLNKAMMEHIQYPSKKNKEKVEDCFRELEKSKQEAQSGELADTINTFLHELEHESEDGIRSYSGLDQLLGKGMVGAMLTVMAGRPGMGKTTYAMNIALEALRRKPDTRIDFFSLEMSQEQLLKKMVSNAMRVNSYRFINPVRTLNDEEKQRVIASLDWIKQTGLKIYDEKVNIDEIERTIRQNEYEATNNGKKYMAIIDYVGLVQTNSMTQQRYHEVGQISQRLKALTNVLDIPIILLSQLNRSVEQREDKRPVPSDLRESGDLEQDANIIMLLSPIYPEDIENNATNLKIRVDVAKNRMGQTGSMVYRYDKPTQRFEEGD